MFVRFREIGQRLQVSLVETRRIGGKVRHEHIASLGSVPSPASVADRVGFWGRLHQRLGQLSNRIDAEMQAKIFGAVHAHIPMATPDEQRAVQLENAEEDARHWSSMRDMHADTVEGHKGLIATAERAIATGEAGAAKAESHAHKARDRVERIKRGEDVPGGLGKPMTREEWEAELIAAGFTRRDLRRMYRLNEIPETIARSVLLPEILKRKDQAENAAINAVWRKHRQQDD
jgi:hypothetical protein